MKTNPVDEFNNISDFYLFYPKNINFVKGLTRWTEQGKRTVIEALLSIPLVVILMVFLIFLDSLSDFGSLLRAFLIFIFGSIIFGLGVWTYLKIRKERNLATNGDLIPGQIVQCRLTNKGSDTNIFGIDYVFNDVTASFETHLDRNDAAQMIGRKILVLFLNESNKLVL